MTRGLAAPEEGSTYELWLFHDGVPRPAGVFEPAADGSLRFILVGARITEVHQYAIAEILGDMAFVGEHRVPADLLTADDQLSQILEVEKLRQRSRFYHVAEQHGQLAALAPSVFPPNLL